MTALLVLILSAIYVVLMTLSGKVVEDRPLPSFWKGCVIALVSPILVGLKDLGKVFIFLGVSCLALVTVVLNKLAPYKERGLFEDRTDLH